MGGLWLGALVLAVAAAAMAPAGEEEDLSMPGTESQKAFDLLDERFPQSNSQGAEARLVFRAPDGQRVSARENKAAVEDALGSLDGGDQIASTTDPYETGAVSEDGTIAYSTVTYTADAVDLTGPTKSALEDAASQARDAGLTVEIGGSALDSEEELGGTTELIGVAVAAVVLVLALGSLVAAGLSLLTAIVGVAIAFGLVSALAVPLGLTSTVAILALMLGLAVGIDYALFITSRFRDERAQGSEPEEAAGRAVGTAGSAVVFAGATVFIALVGLGVVGIPELTKMGLGGAGAVALAVLVALTLVPALFGFFGRRVLSRRVRKATRPGSERPHPAPTAAGRPRLGTRWAGFVLRRPVAVLLISGLDQITLANAQATVAAHLFDTRPEQTRKSLQELVETTSNALDELRATVGLLRQSGDTASPAEPAPGLSRLPTLLESFRRAGLEVSVRQEGTARPLPPGVDLTAFRIVQEALTNVTKHARTGSAWVRLVWNRDRVTITVADDGGGVRTASTAATGPGASTAGDRPPGYGLIGMRERATAVGGSLSAGRRPEGGFLVSAQLPLPPAKDAPHRADAATVIENRMADAATGDGRTGDAETGDAL
ncbi:hypothetical protein SALBM311S_08857 [Streptomyces alboniger]